MNFNCWLLLSLWAQKYLFNLIIEFMSLTLSGNGYCSELKHLIAQEKLFNNDA